MEDKELGCTDLCGLIEEISSMNQSGMLQIGAAGSLGAFFFSNGKLVDAQFRSLTGFQAVNAVFAMRDAHFTFDPSISPPVLSSITPAEHVILKRFFGLESVDVEHSDENLGGEVDWNLTPEPVVPFSEVPELSDSKEDPAHVASHLVIQDESESSDAGVEGEREPVLISSSHSRPRWAFPIGMSSRAVLYLGVLLFLVFGAIAVISNFNRRRVLTPANPVDSLSATASPAVPERQESVADDSSAHSLAGEWKVVNTVDKTSYKGFGNLQIGFRLVISQTGSAFTAQGEKVSENGRPLPANERTPIHVNGSIKGDRVVATFIEHGARRKTSGRFEWKIQGADAGLAGTFVTSAAKSSGRSAAMKQL
jgi:uncharacterized protein DUF4388